MNAKWVYQSFDIKSWSPQNFFILAHGGAGPQDYKQTVNQPIIDELFSGKDFLKAYQGFRTKHQSDVEAMSLSETLCLTGAELLENHPSFNAGYGGALQADGKVRLSASYMNSERGTFSAVMNMEERKNPSWLAYKLQNNKHSVRDNQGAKNLADQLGMPKDNLITEARLNSWKKHQAENNSGKTGTIGCITYANQQITSCTSTGGIGNEVVGRIGDSPTIAGNYCDELTGVSCTGIGEQITALGVAHRICVRAYDGMGFEKACEKTILEAEKKQYELAFISLHKNVKQQKLEVFCGFSYSNLTWTTLQGSI